MTTENTLIGKMVDLFEEPEGNANIIDLDFALIDDNNDWNTVTRSMVEKNSFAVMNSYRMWLDSKRGDYIRENPDESGYFQFALNNKYLFEKANEENSKNDIIRLTGERFPLIRLVDCSVTANYGTMQWDIKIAIEDLKSGNFAVVDESLDAVTQETNQGYLEVGNS